MIIGNSAEEEDFKNKFCEEISKKIYDENSVMSNYFNKKIEDDTDEFDNKIVKNNEKLGKLKLLNLTFLISIRR